MSLPYMNAILLTQHFKSSEGKTLKEFPVKKLKFDAISNILYNL